MWCEVCKQEGRQKGRQGRGAEARKAVRWGWEVMELQQPHQRQRLADVARIRHLHQPELVPAAAEAIVASAQSIDINGGGFGRKGCQWTGDSVWGYGCVLTVAYETGGCSGASEH